MTSSLPTLNHDIVNIQLNSFDSYQIKPSATLDNLISKSLPGYKFTQVPVVRVYGSLPTGHNVLLHIHGILPYIFCKYPFDEIDNISEKCANFHSLLESSLAESYDRRAAVDDEGQEEHFEANYDGNASTRDNYVQNDTEEEKTLKYIADVTVVKGTLFYGYNREPTLFFRIQLLNPQYQSRLSDILRDGKLQSQMYEIYEAHIPHLLQFLTDFNLFGCGWIKCSNVYVRTPIVNPDLLQFQDVLITNELNEFLETWSTPERMLTDTIFPRMSNSLLEFDVLPQFILNRHDLLSTVNFKDMEATQKLSSMTELWKEIRFQRQVHKIEKYHPPKDVPRLFERKVWADQKILDDLFQKAIENTSDKKGESPKQAIQMENVMHAFEAVSYNWPSIPSNPNIGDFSLSSSFPVHEKTEEMLDIADYNNFVDEEPEEPEEHQKSFLESPEKTYDTSKPLTTVSFSDITFTQSRVQTKRRKVSFAVRIDKERHKFLKGNFQIYDRVPPILYDDIMYDIEADGLPKIDYQGPHYSNSGDLSNKPFIYARKKFELTEGDKYRPAEYLGEMFQQKNSTNTSWRTWNYIVPPPRLNDVMKDLSSSKRKFLSQIEFATQKYKYGYKYGSPKSSMQKRSGTSNSMTVLTMELQTANRDHFYPDPEKDEINAIFWKIERESLLVDTGISDEGILVFDKENRYEKVNSLSDTPMAFFDTEIEMIHELISLVKLVDPDTLSGYEIHNSSWGYLIGRCRKFHEWDVCEDLSRVNTKMKNKVGDRWGYTRTSSIRISGRHMINIWRPLRQEINLLKYDFENVVFHVLHLRIPHYSYETLTAFWNGDNTSILTVLNYWLIRVRLNIKLMQSQEVINRTMEQARMIGIDFSSVFYRGSQFKVESLLVRLAKAGGYMLLSPNKKQVRKQKALECIPLVMEPKSGLYKSPLVVLDFQSLYPSIMIAYNYCYSTLVGRLRGMNLKGNKIGTGKVDIPVGLLKELQNDFNISPNGNLYVKSHIRRSTLADMLTAMLDTRVLVKSTMNLLKDEALVKPLNNRQLALKLIANVTYGYTSASFSGRMPCSDIADSIVQTGRETLEEAIKMIEANQEWGAHVVYGDTDSLFIYFPGKTRADAFKLGKQIAAEVTKVNPAPVKLKFEKVYHPCVLVSKKRYVGYAYDHEDQAVPKFDAKGIETVRRDGHPAQQKIVEKSLKLLFDTMDMSQVKSYVQAQFSKILQGNVSIQDFCFAREVKLGKYKSEKTIPAGALLSTKIMAKDHRAVPQYNQRIPYVVIKGKPGQTLRERCVTPQDLIESEHMELDSEYYISKTLIPPLERIFNLIGADVRKWYQEMPKIKTFNYDIGNRVNSLHGWVKSDLCVLCEQVCVEIQDTVCDSCKTPATMMAICAKTKSQNDKLQRIINTCQSCVHKLNYDGMNYRKQVDACVSQDCPVYYSRVKAVKDDFQNSQALHQILLDW